MKKRFFKVILPLLSIIMLVIMIVGGCARTTTEPLPAEPAADEPAVDEPAAPDAEEKPLVFGNIPAALSDEWNGYSVENFMFAAEKKGVEVQVIDPNWDGERALNSLEDFIIKDVDAVSVFVLTPEQAQAFVDIANAAQMPIAFENTNLSDNPHFPPLTGEYVFNVHEDYRTEAYKSVSYAAENNLGSKLFFLRGSPGMGIAEESHAGVEMAVAEYDNIELVGYRDTMWNTETGQNALSDVIQAGIDFDVVFCNNEPIAVGAMNALRDAGLEGEIPIVASNGSPNGLKMIEEGQLAATVSVPVSLQGLYIFKALYLYVTEGIVPPYKRIVIPSMLIDQSNVHEAISWMPSEGLIDLIGGLDDWDTKGVGEHYE
jgi:ribose transport system substrate-binding protein